MELIETSDSWVSGYVTSVVREYHKHSGCSVIGGTPMCGKQDIVNTFKPHNVKCAIVFASVEAHSWITKTNTLCKLYEVYPSSSESPEGEDSDGVVHIHVNPQVSRNAREALSFLTYIAENYETLPDAVLFLHGDEHDHHTLTGVEDTKKAAMEFFPFGDLERDAIIYVRSMRTAEYNHFHHESKHEVELKVDELWDSVFEKHGFGSREGVQVLSPCCAQFGVSKAAIRLRPVEYYRATVDLELQGRHREYR